MVAVTVSFLPLGLDTRAGVFRVESEQGSSYLLKVRSSAVSEPSLVVPRYLRDQGIAQVVAPIPTESDELWTMVGKWSAVLYPFVEGVTTWNPGLTDEEWKNVGVGLKRIHNTALPPGGFESIRRETFDPTKYSSWISEFEAQQAELAGGTKNERRLRRLWVEHANVIAAGVDRMEEIGRMIRERNSTLVICHADLHPGNMIRNEAGKVYVVDWDDVMLGLKERDFLFVDGVLKKGVENLPFFQGYGSTRIDWGAFTYYMWERLITDLMACTQDVCFRADLEEQTKAEAVDLFAAVLRENDEYGMVKAAEAHIADG